MQNETILNELQNFTITNSQQRHYFCIAELIFQRSNRSLKYLENG